MVFRQVNGWSQYCKTGIECSMVLLMLVIIIIIEAPHKAQDPSLYCISNSGVIQTSTLEAETLSKDE